MENKNKVENKIKDTKSIKEKVADAFDFPKEIMLDAAKLVLLGERDLTIENYKGIIEYDENVIRIKTVGREFKVTGSSLEIKTITDEEIQIVGSINAIELTR